MAKQNELTVKYLDEIPEVLDEGVFYISLKYGTAIHLCACGCRGKTVTPLEPKLGGWSLQDNGGEITIRPSIGNFIGEDPYHAHYLITNNKIEWLT